MIKCPYCNGEFEPDTEDLPDPDDSALIECRGCGKIFGFDFYITFDFYEYKTPCQNDTECSYRPTKIYPVEATRMKCKWCGDERPLTGPEWEEFNELQN